MLRKEKLTNREKALLQMESIFHTLLGIGKRRVFKNSIHLRITNKDRNLAVSKVISDEVLYRAQFGEEFEVGKMIVDTMREMEVDEAEVSIRRLPQYPWLNKEYGGHR